MAERRVRSLTLRSVSMETQILILILMFLEKPANRFSIDLFAFERPPSIGTSRILLLHPLHGIVKPKRTSRTITAFGNLHNGQGTSIVFLSKLNTEALK